VRRDLKTWLQDALKHPTTESVGRLLADEETAAERLAPRMSKINKIALVPLGPDDVFVRGANICNNVIDYYDSRFTEKALRQIARLIPGAPMTRGHQMDHWAYAATFDADVLENEKAKSQRLKELRDVGLADWVRGLFFWPKAASWANDLRVRIDGGLTREVSAHWRFEKATCSICSEDIRRCPHMPGEEYENADKTKSRCFYEMEQVTEYLETGFVVRGGQKNTAIWGPGMEEAAERVLFGEAIREIKSRKTMWDEWKRSLDQTNGTVSAAGWLGRGLGRR